MANLFTGLVKAGYYTAQALLNGPSKTLQEMYSAQEDRYRAFADMITSLSYEPHQILARKQYWCGQTFFLAQLINANVDKIEEIIKAPVSVKGEAGLLNTINKLLIAMDDTGHLQKFITLLEEDGKKVATTELKSFVTSTVLPQQGMHFICGDVIQLVKNLTDQGTMVVVNNAPNSHRDGASKYSAGSVEELFSRYTDEALKMVLHFDDVHQRNDESGHYAFAQKPKPADVIDYQRRYLKMIFAISAKLIEKKESYLESDEFFNDLFNSFPQTSSNQLTNKLPIYFDMQNNAYEVPVDRGFVSSHWFADTKNLSTVEGVFHLLEKPYSLTPVTIASYAAPDLRKIETSPLDARATSNKTLQHPETQGTLGTMLTAGIAYQCQQAIILAQQFKDKGINQPVAVVFVMPGCGAFNNPQKTTAAHFISTIKHFYPELEQHNISCHIVEHSPELFKVLEKTNELYGPELGQLNEVINKLTDPHLRRKAIAVRENIVSLYERGENPVTLAKHTSLTTQLLMAKSDETRCKIANEYQKNALEMTTNPNLFWQILGASMITLGAAILAVGVAFATSGIGLIPSAGVLAGGTALLVGGIGLFATGSKGLVEKTSELVDEALSESFNC